MKIAMKGAGDARRTDGPYSALYDEVTASCNRADKAEMQKDYSDLGQSVKAREDYQKFPAHTEKWEKHRWRYMQEKNELVPYIKGLL